MKEVSVLYFYTTSDLKFLSKGEKVHVNLRKDIICKVFLDFSSFCLIKLEQGPHPLLELERDQSDSHFIDWMLI